MEIKKIGVFGLGVVGKAVYEFFENRVDIYGYDKYKEEFPWDEIKIKECDLIFFCLPTPVSKDAIPISGNTLCESQDLSTIEENVKKLEEIDYKQLVLIKSTVLPGVTSHFQRLNPKISFYHSPEFLSELTAHEDFENQRLIIIGKAGIFKHEDNELIKFFEKFFPKVITTTSEESEMVKYTANCFYATKVSFFTSIYETCRKLHIDFETVKNLAIASREWINPMHTNVPGRHGLGYGGMCLPKDCEAFGKLNPFVRLVYVFNSIIREKNKIC
jgi:nucleotide sugar dehydrogenase